MAGYVDAQALAAAVSRRLGKQRLVERSSTAGSRVSGFPTTYDGFRVTAAADAAFGCVAAWVTFVPSGSDVRHRRAAAIERQAQRTVWLRSWLIGEGVEGWSIGPIVTDRLGDLRFVVEAPAKY
jgi:hypothetical protein